MSIRITSFSMKKLHCPTCDSMMLSLSGWVTLDYYNRALGTCVCYNCNTMFHVEAWPTMFDDGSIIFYAEQPLIAPIAAHKPVALDVP